MTQQHKQYCPLLPTDDILCNSIFAYLDFAYCMKHIRLVCKHFCELIKQFVYPNIVTMPKYFHRAMYFCQCCCQKNNLIFDKTMRVNLQASATTHWQAHDLAKILNHFPNAEHVNADEFLLPESDKKEENEINYLWCIVDACKKVKIVQMAFANSQVQAMLQESQLCENVIRHVTTHLNTQVTLVDTHGMRTVCNLVPTLSYAPASADFEQVYLQTLKQLESLGVDITLPMLDNSFLDMAARCGYTKVANYLICMCNMDASYHRSNMLSADMTCMEPIVAATIGQNIGMVKYLITLGVPYKYKNESGATIIPCAIAACKCMLYDKLVPLSAELKEDFPDLEFLCPFVPPQDVTMVLRLLISSISSSSNYFYAISQHYDKELVIDILKRDYELCTIDDQGRHFWHYAYNGLQRASGSLWLQNAIRLLSIVEQFKPELLTLLKEEDNNGDSFVREVVNALTQVNFGNKTSHMSKVMHQNYARHKQQLLVLLISKFKVEINYNNDPIMVLKTATTSRDAEVHAETFAYLLKQNISHYKKPNKLNALVTNFAHWNFLKAIITGLSISLDVLFAVRNDAGSSIVLDSTLRIAPGLRVETLTYMHSHSTAATLRLFCGSAIFTDLNDSQFMKFVYLGFKPRDAETTNMLLWLAEKCSHAFCHVAYLDYLRALQRRGYNLKPYFGTKIELPALHKILKKKTYLHGCPLCGTVFKTESALKMHQTDLGHMSIH